MSRLPEVLEPSRGILTGSAITSAYKPVLWLVQTCHIPPAEREIRAAITHHCCRDLSKLLLVHNREKLFNSAAITKHLYIFSIKRQWPSPCWVVFWSMSPVTCPKEEISRYRPRHCECLYHIWQYYQGSVMVSRTPYLCNDNVPGIAQCALFYMTGSFSLSSHLSFRNLNKGS